MNITDPQDHRQYDDHDVKVAGEAFSINSIREIIIRIDGTEIDKVSNTGVYSRVFNLNTGPHTIQMTARDDQGREATGEVKIGVNVAWDTPIESPSPSPSPTPLP